MRFRPCIDLHAGRVKQIVGSTLRDDATLPQTNFDSDFPPAYYADMYYNDGLAGGHVIKLGPGNDEAAREALAAHPGFLQVGGGMNAENARQWLDDGAQKIIVTSWLFSTDGTFLEDRLKTLAKTVSPERLVVDLSCKAVDGHYFVAVNRWQTLTTMELSIESFSQLAPLCREFLVHAVNVEGMQKGIDERLVELLGRVARQTGVSMTYAGGIASLEDVARVALLGEKSVDFTIGSALDIFGGHLKYQDVVKAVENLD